MNNDIFEGNWKTVKGKLMEKWGKLTNDDLDVATGHREQVLGKLQARYGMAKEEAERQIKAFEASYRSATTT